MKTGLFVAWKAREKIRFKQAVARVGRILVSDKIFNIPVVAIHCRNNQNVGFENPTYGKLKILCVLRLACCI
ncbi:hypothetical protein E4K39_00540 [Neisseria meningitidis]|nr:hypothetical protein [Neisseria meningitidis]MBG8586395.1 hypothetical protein [Neisseria meningitidis]MBG8590825.1 hypothetical protein [Neisseria meningitidis]MBG8599698.1 hypothetical protein [Neisseria meningitidis]MBG8606410.1 hypothetical protein [Neisseria meningitidis]